VSVAVRFVAGERIAADYAAAVDAAARWRGGGGQVVGVAPDLSLGLARFADAACFRSRTRVILRCCPING
jgi:hypothetical protein